MKVHSKDRVSICRWRNSDETCKRHGNNWNYEQKVVKGIKGAVHSACTASAAEVVCLRRQKESTACSCNTNEKREVPGCKMPTESRKKKETDFHLKKSLSNEGVCEKRRKKTENRLIWFSKDVLYLFLCVRVLFCRYTCASHACLVPLEVRKEHWMPGD